MKKTIFATIIFFGFLALVAAPVLAKIEIGTELGKVAPIADLEGDTDLITTVGNVIKIFLGFLGLIALIIFVYAGFKWMTSGGNDEAIAGAKKLMSAAIIGIFIILIAYAATIYVVNKMTEVTTCVDDYVKCDANGANYSICGSGAWKSDSTYTCASVAGAEDYCLPGAITDSEENLCIYAVCLDGSVKCTDGIKYITCSGGEFLGATGTCGPGTCIAGKIADTAANLCIAPAPPAPPPAP